MRRDVLVLAYHAISQRWPAELAVTPAAFERQVSYLHSSGYRGVTFGDAVNSDTSGKVVAVTFDDGYRSVLELAKPVLDRYDMPGTVFPVTDHVGSRSPMSWPGITQWLDGPHAPELVSLSWSDLEKMADAGWEIGSHTCSHPRLPEMDDESLKRELESSREVLASHLERECGSVAYPYGAVDGRVADAARQAGYTAGAALPIRLTGTALEWPRVGIYRRDAQARFRLKVSPAARRLRKTIGGALLQHARS